jgi:hypothetical protein
MNIKRFMIGDEVKVIAHHVSKVGRGGTRANQRVHTRQEFKEFVVGKVIGIKKLQIGKIISGGYEEQGYFKVSETKLCWVVRFGMLNKEVYVIDGDIELIRPAVYVSYPDADKNRRGVSESLNLVSIKKSKQKVVYYFSLVEWTKENKAEQREYAKVQNRDKQGRFMKGRNEND